MQFLIHAAMVFVLQFVPVVMTSLDSVTPGGVAGYVDCTRESVTVHVLRVYDDLGVESPFFERLAFERQWLLAADCIDDGAINGSLAPAASDSPFLAQRAQAWVEWAQGHRQEAAALLTSRAHEAVVRAAASAHLE